MSDGPNEVTIDIAPVEPVSPVEAAEAAEAPAPLEAPAETPAPTPIEGTDVQETLEIQEDPGAYWNRYTEEYTENGALSPESRAQIIAERGVTEAQLDTYIEGMAAKAELSEIKGQMLLNEINQTVGGQEGLSQLKSWAQSALSQEELGLFNQEVQSKNFARIKAAVTNLHARYRVANPSGNLVSGSPHPAPGIAPYQSHAQWLADMSKPEYKQDPAFQAECDKRATEAMRLGVF